MIPLSSERQKLESKITFLQQQLDSLEHYLPDTYQYLLIEMDAQQVLLKRLEVQDHFAAIDSSTGTLRSCSVLESNSRGH